MTIQIAVFGASATPPGHPDYEQAVRCGVLLAEAGFTVATGGYGGLMEAVSRGASGAGGRVVGITAPALFPQRTGANVHVAEERPAPDLMSRIGDLIDSSAGSIALQGSLGTMTELMVAWNDAYIARLGGAPPRPVVAVGGIWEEFVTTIGTRLSTDASLVTCVATVDDAVAEILRRVP